MIILPARFRFPTIAVTLFFCSCARPARVARVPNAPPPPVSAFERQVTNATDAGDGDFVVKSLREKVITQPDELGPRLELAKAYRQRGYPELAIEHYRLAASRFPESPETRLLLAQSLRAAGAAAEAADSLEQFLQTHPQSSPKYASWLGILRDELGQWTRGEAHHRAALSLAPQRDDLHNNLGYCLLMQGQNWRATEEFREALKLNRDSRIARNNLGMALAATPGEAVLNWQSVSDPASAHNNMAAMLIGEKKYEAARKELVVALGYNNAHSAARNNLKLVSTLDGKPASVPAKPAKKRWARVRYAWLRAMTRAKGIKDLPENI